MNIKVTAHGVVVPRRLFGEAKEVEVRQEEDRIVLVPVGEEPLPENDPIYRLGRNPVKLGLPDASINHDRYLTEPDA